MDYLSRHPLAITGTDSTEKAVKSTFIAEHAVVLDSIEKTMTFHHSIASDMNFMS